MRTAPRCLLAIAAAASSFALAQAPAPAPAPGAGFAPFKGKLKEGLYEMKSEHDMSGVPGVPKEHHKGAETKQRCMTRAEADRGINAGKGCKIASSKESGNNANVRMECQDGTVTEMALALTPNGYTSEMKTTGKQDGKSFTSIFRSQARYLGPCPAAPAPAK
jgi:hypothetical protein